MWRTRTVRFVTLLVLYCFAAQYSGFERALAADGSVHGSARADGGQLPTGAVVKATPVTGGSPSTAAIAADGKYVFAKLPEGPYVFQVEDQEGKPLGPAHKTLVPPRAVQMDLFVPLGAAAAVDAENNQSKKKGAAGAPMSMSKTRFWLLLGTAFAVGVGAGFLLDDDSSSEDQPVSPSTP